MNDKEKTNYTKKKLRLTFSLIVFVIVFVLWLLFVLWTYSWIRYQQYKSFSFLVKSVESKKITLDVISYIWEDLKNDEKKFNWSLNYIILENNTIIKKYIDSDFPSKEINTIIKQTWNEIYQWKNYISKWLYIAHQKVFLISKISYTLEYLIRDILFSFFIALLSSWIFFILLWRYINKIFIPVEENISNMNDFIHNAWHELQTPLSVIVSDIDFYIENKEWNDSILIEIKDEAKKMWELIKTLLRISKENYSINIEEFNVSILISEIISQFQDKINVKDIKIFLEVDENININANRNHLFICIANILWNAIKYNIDKWVIKIKFQDNIFTIEDSWGWIEKENLEKIFDRFYKEDKSRTTGGFWIGLSLVKKLSDLNSWKVEVKSEKDIWSSFYIFV